MTKTELEAENERLHAEVFAHRKLLAAIHDMATVAAPADWTAPAYLCAVEARCYTIAAYAGYLDGVTPDIMARVLADRAKVLSGEASRPVRYALKEPEPASPEAVAALAGSIATGTPLLVADDEAPSAVPA